MVNNLRLDKKNYVNVLKEYLIIIGLLALIVVTSIVEPKFLTVANLTNVLRQFGPPGLVALGVTFVLLGGYIDLSVGGTFSVAAVIAMLTANQYGQLQGLVVAIGVGAALGCLNGLILLLFGAKSSADGLFITYGMGIVCGSISQIITGGGTEHLDRGPLTDTVGKGTIGFLPISFVIFLVALVVLYIFQKRTYAGRSIMMTGGNPTAARLSGIPVNRSIFIMYLLSGLMAGIGAFVLFSRVTTANPSVGRGYETDALMAVVIGGTSLNGGQGSVVRTMIGVALVTLMSNCLNLLGVTPYMQYIVKGLILIAAIWLDSKKER